jgi:histidyl-tRNA synthetase
MMAADTMEALGIPRGSYVVKVNNRRLLDGLMDSIDLPDESISGQRLTVLRALDKYDRLGTAGVRALLGPGRKDESGDFTKGANLRDDQINQLMMIFEMSPQVSQEFDSLPQWEQQDSSFVDVRLEPHSGRLVREIHPEFKPGSIPINNEATISLLRGWFGDSPKIKEALDGLSEIAGLARSARYGSKRILIDPSVVRGLEYYTGPVYEVELAFPTTGDDGKPVRFGSVGGGGRYDGLVARFRGEPVPATGFSIGVSRLLAALTHLGKVATKPDPGPVIVTVFDKDRIADYQRMASMLRQAGIRAELYLGSGKFGPQMKYADRRGSPCVVIQGSDEKAKGEVQIKDLILGAELAGLSKERDDYLQKQAAAQFAVPETDLVAKVREVLARHEVKWG